MSATTLSTLAEDVRSGLSATPKRLPPWMFYDAEGSRLFEAITELPEYYLTRTERAILERRADEMIAAAGQGLSLAELGAGTATKTRLLVEALLSRQGRGIYMPIDVSPSTLRTCSAGKRASSSTWAMASALGETSMGM